MLSALLVPGRELTTLMPWVRFDDQFATHRKVDGLSDTAFRLHVAAIFWCARNLMDGFVPEGDLDLVCARVRAPARFAAECVRRGLWHDARRDCPSPDCPAPADGEGWVIHDYFQYQPRKEEVLAERSGKSDGGKLGNHRRWHAERGVTDPACGYCRKPSGRASDDRSDKRYSRSDIHSPPSDIRSDTDRSSESGPNPPVPSRPGLSVVDVSNQSSRRNAREDWVQRPLASAIASTAGHLTHPEDDDDVLKAVKRSMRDRTGRDIPAAVARDIAAGIFRRSKGAIGNPADYAETAIRNEPDPAARWLAAHPAAPEPRLEWCGKCSDPARRQRERPDGKIERCPDCHSSARKETA